MEKCSQKSKHLSLRTKVFATLGKTLADSEFHDLSIFRESIEASGSGLHHYPYTTNKNKIFIYKTIFFSLGACFAFFVWFLYASSYSWIVSLIFGSHIQVKLTACALAALFSAAAFALGFKISPETEILNDTINVAKQKAKQIYSRKLLEIGCTLNSNAKSGEEESLFIRNLYHDVLEKIGQYKQEAMLTVKRIKISKTLNEDQKEHLYNQTIFELQRKLETLIDCYHDNHLLPIDCEEDEA